MVHHDGTSQLYHKKLEKTIETEEIFMNDIKVFSSTEFGELGIMLIDGKEYFPATQCAKILGYASPKDAITRHCKGAIKRRLPTAGGEQDVKFIPEGDLYRLIVSSKLPAAEKFERWVFEEVLPSIRKTGGYGNINLEQVIAQTATAVVSEVVKQLVPVLAAASFGKAVQTAEISPKRRARKYTYTQPTKMETLPPDVKEHADEMIISGQYSCREVANYIINTTGQYISQMAVNRYKRKFFDTNADDGQLCLM